MRGNLKISKLTFFWAGFIVVSAAFMRQLADLAKELIGQGRLFFVISALLISFAAGLLVIVLKAGFKPIKTPVFILVLTAGIAFAWQMKLPIEKIHILEYGLLGWLATRDLCRDKVNLTRAVLAVGFAFIVGILDESFQAFLPYRYFDLRDIWFNSLGGIWGASLFLLRR